jgi:hypothetical protein
MREKSKNAILENYSITSVEGDIVKPLRNMRSTYFSFVILSPSEIISELVLKYKVLHHPVKEEGSRGFNMINGNVILGKFSTMG